MAGGGTQEADEAITGINVTPLVDITLVLLIIFMVTTRIVMNQTVPLDLPKAVNGQSDVQVVFSIILTTDGRAMVDSKPIANDDAVLPLARDALAQHPDRARSSRPTRPSPTAGSFTCSIC
jgi:biopolymer transport protein ExbD